MRLLYMALLIYGVSFSQSLKETVYFGYDSHILSSTEQEKLDKLALVTDTIRIGAITVTAFCDDRGSAGYNLALSKMRARAVAAAFKGKSIRAHGAGEIPLRTGQGTTTQRDLNRRAEIMISYTPGPNRTTAPRPAPEPDTAATVTDTALAPEAAGPVEYRNIEERDFLPGDRILLRNIQFVSGRSVLVKRSERELVNILLFMQRNPNVIVEIQGHVCCIADSHKDAVDEDTFTPNLSENRARKIYDYLIKKGIAPARMTYKGYGRQFPLQGGWEEDNKRVEILVTGMLED